MLLGAKEDAGKRGEAELMEVCHVILGAKQICMNPAC